MLKCQGHDSYLMRHALMLIDYRSDANIFRCFNVSIFASSIGYKGGKGGLIDCSSYIEHHF